MLLGDVRWNLGLYRHAASAYAEAQRRGNRTRNLQLKLGRAQRWSGDLAGARETFAALLAIYPDDPEALAELRALPR